MWRSAIGLSLSAYKDPNFHMWIKDYPLLGTGPCTIKCFFPRYRRPEYGRLEGGHNFTPDKLHNDYVNLIATNGLVGFAVYYILFIPYCGYLFIKRLKDYPNAPSNYLLIGLMSGLLVYLGQVMFNFGVVATRVLFYELLGLAMAILINN
jgi:O-antigen ligase